MYCTMTERVCSIRLPWRIPVCTAKCSYKLWGILQLCCSNDNKIMFHTFALHSLAGLFWVTSTTDKHNPLKIQLQTSRSIFYFRVSDGQDGTWENCLFSNATRNVALFFVK
jgi:hypothetical protein